MKLTVSISLALCQDIIKTLNAYFLYQNLMIKNLEKWGQDSSECKAHYNRSYCTATGKCPTPDMGVWCCCGGNEGVFLEKQNVTCTEHFQRSDCAAIRIVCPSCNPADNFCDCHKKREASG